MREHYMKKKTNYPYSIGIVMLLVLMFGLVAYGTVEIILWEIERDKTWQHIETIIPDIVGRKFTQDDIYKTNAVFANSIDSSICYKVQCKHSAYYIYLNKNTNIVYKVNSVRLKH